MQRRRYTVPSHAWPAVPSSPRRTNSKWIIAAVVLGVTIGSLALLAVLLGVGYRKGWPAPLAARDREVLASASGLIQVQDFVLRSDGESFSKTQYFDGRTELSYRYDHPDPAAPFHLSSRTIVAATRAEAHSIYRQSVSAVDAAGSTRGAALQDSRTDFSWGDDWHRRELDERGKVVGHVLACRHGQKVFCLELVGVGLDDSQFAELVAPVLESLEKYSP